MAVIYFDKDSQVNAKQYAEDARIQNVCNKISNGIEKAAIVACSLVSGVAVAIIMFVAFLSERSQYVRSF